MESENQFGEGKEGHFLPSFWDTLAMENGFHSWAYKSNFIAH